MTAFEGDTGPYLQYAHARLCSITRKAALTSEEIAKADLSLLTEVHAQNLIRVIAQYPDVVQNTLKTLEPATILTYLFKMTHTLSSSYDHLRIVGSERELMLARMALYDAARVVLHNGMRLLGLSPVERLVFLPRTYYFCKLTKMIQNVRSVLGVLYAYMHELADDMLTVYTALRKRYTGKEKHNLSRRDTSGLQCKAPLE